LFYREIPVNRVVATVPREICADAALGGRKSFLNHKSLNRKGPVLPVWHMGCKEVWRGFLPRGFPEVFFEEDKPMHVNFRSLHDYHDFLYSEYETVNGVGDQIVGDQFARGVRKFADLTDDLSLDDSIVDLDDLG